ncbi:MAG: methyltransferase domain-containing protein [Candidatus Woesearchaeota archaeon]|nr:methyltransferase domain-containing protein [Candidatus Woesearchaeota archaeon]MDP7198833.1 methyltransferase domain-containing protein [Candidatus Woesearchaeota archaeon]MDP7467167.1 methyltransferase domain-containing protein [Candidatus Woesearchaeota archaeon]MDP7647498.1 methyltransferase domain-containing protein [Candidatus Woesearchaeota archaeon]
MKELPADVLATKEDKRFATTEIVADYRAQRLACDTLLEIGCGVGMQTRSFAETCKKVIAVDTDKRKVIFARKNCKASNVDFHVGDGLKVLESTEADVVFCDPERPASEGQRKLSSLQPDPTKLLEMCEEKGAALAIELPPQIQQVSFPAELEYLDVGGKLNRLTAYTGRLARSSASVVALPSRYRIEGNKGEGKEGHVGEWLSELSPAVVKAGLVGQFGEGVSDGKAWYVTNKLQNPFVVNTYKVLGEAENVEEAVVLLKKHGFGKVLLRLRVKPEEYWRVRKQVEADLEGEKQAALLEIHQKLYVVSKV